MIITKFKTYVEKVAEFLSGVVFCRPLFCANHRSVVDMLEITPKPADLTRYTYSKSKDTEKLYLCQERMFITWNTEDCILHDLLHCLELYCTGIHIEQLLRRNSCKVFKFEYLQSVIKCLPTKNIFCIINICSLSRNKLTLTSTVCLPATRRKINIKTD